MERVTLEARRRDGLGKGEARRLRQAGQVPGVVYGRGREPLSVAVEAKSLRDVLHTQAGKNVLIDLAIGNGDRGAATVMVKDLQRDIFVRDIIHVDFYCVELTQRLQTRVPIHFVGQPAGIAEGGVLEVHLREVTVECLPTQIPESVEVNISDLGVGDAIHIRDLAVPAETTVITPPEEVVATVVIPKVIEEAAPAAAAGAPEAAATPEAAAAATAPAPAAKPETKGEAKPAEKAKPPSAEKAKPAAAEKSKPEA
jgi:large subunit ribosomal protein L25